MNIIFIKRQLYALRHDYLTINNLVTAAAILVAFSWAWGSVEAMQQNYELQRSIDKLFIKTSASLVSAGTERMLIDFGKGNYLQKARQQPDKVRMVIDKIKTDGLMPTVDSVFAKLDTPLPLGC